MIFNFLKSVNFYLSSSKLVPVKINLHSFIFYSTLFILTLSSLKTHSQTDQAFKEYSYAEFYKLIEEEQDSVFELKDALIKPNAKTDSLFSYKSKFIDFNTSDYDFKRKDTLIINKELILDNVHFFNSGRMNTSFYNLQFNKKVSLINMSKANFINCAFLDVLVIKNDSQFELNTFDKLRNLGERSMHFDFDNCDFKGGVDLTSVGSKPRQDEHIVLQFEFKNSNFYALNENHTPYANIFCSFRTGNISNFSFHNNRFTGEGYMLMIIQNSGSGSITDNDFGNVKVILRHNIDSDQFKSQFKNNRFNKPVFLSMNEDFKHLNIDWFQFKGKIINDFSYGQIYGLNEKLLNPKNINTFWSDSIVNRYLNQYRIENKEAYKAETKQLGDFYAYYKKNHDNESANAAYIELKDLETARLAFNYNQDPSFKSFFTWKINQFLKVFSAYGTEPARAVIFSLYVILFFALIYLFFPNSWDKHGKNRIIDRYSFFFKYMNKQAGIHEVYLEDQKAEIMQYDTFKNLIKNSNQSVPKFFSATALPLYKWAISSTKISASFLSKIDIMKGTWSELPKSKRIWKSLLLVGAFLIAILYDIFIKILNALMLSINTFTTLGFGEIPIKGLPRYLAIIQGFIGWFMLTIFSVSLISQLLN